MNADQKIMAVRSGLVLDEPFWGRLILKLKMVPDPTCHTAWTDGFSMGYNPAYIESLSLDETKGVCVHEVGHCALGHPWREGGRDHHTWNEACDYVLNGMLVDAGYKLPKGVLLDAQYTGKSAEWVYDRLPRKPKGGQSQQSQGQGQGQGQQDQPQQGQGQQGTPDQAGTPQKGQGQGQDASTGSQAGSGQDEPSRPVTEEYKHPHGEIRPAPTGQEATDAEATEADWKRAVQEAARIAEARGNLPGSLKRFADETARPLVDWKAVLRRFLQQAARTDYSWSFPSRRYLAQGLYMPSLHQYGMGPIVFVVDTSGSTDRVLLSQYCAEANQAVEELKPARTHVVMCDARVHSVETFEQGDPITMEPVGGGGTDFRPAFKAVEDLDEPPVCLVYLTDLYGTFPPTEPDYPVLWATTSRKQAPWGETVEIAL